ncbi:MAG TPA: hypothetical protein GXX51_06875 [Firmicutes bacterium]|nr:hypothetical protein [Bacillota bacterium]
MEAVSISLRLRRRGISSPRSQRFYVDLKCFGRWQKAVGYAGPVWEFRRVLRLATGDTRPLRVVGPDEAA